MALFGSGKREFSGAVGTFSGEGIFADTTSKGSFGTSSIDQLFGEFSTFLSETTSGFGVTLDTSTNKAISAELGRGADEFRVQSQSGFAPTASVITRRFNFNRGDAASITESFADIFVEIARTGNDDLIQRIVEEEGNTSGSTFQAIQNLLSGNVADDDTAPEDTTKEELAAVDTAIEENKDVPTAQNVSVQVARRREKRRRLRLSALGSTLATSGRGDTGVANTGNKQLLGQ